jgi:D-methionine transport system ATP-binding protein
VKLQLTGISYHFPRSSRSIVKDLDLSFTEGEWVGLMGATGSGKTTLLKLLNRSIEPTTGSLLLDNIQYTQIDPIALRKRVILVPQVPNLLGMGVGEALGYPLRLRNIQTSEIKQRIVEVTEALEIPQGWLERSQNQLSIGELQIISIARGVICQPEILLLDEPLAHLDEATAIKLLVNIQTLIPSKGGIVAIAFHQLALVSARIDRLLLLENGKLSVNSPINELNLNEISERVRQLELDRSDEWDE